MKCRNTALARQCLRLQAASPLVLSRLRFNSCVRVLRTCLRSAPYAKWYQADLCPTPGRHAMSNVHWKWCIKQMIAKPVVWRRVRSARVKPSPGHADVELRAACSSPRGAANVKSAFDPTSLFMSKSNIAHVEGLWTTSDHLNEQEICTLGTYAA